jgi:two-component system OmpR family sensor kinase
MLGVGCWVLDVLSPMIFKSIRWRLQIWYGLILLAVLAGFGVTAFQLQRGRQLRRIEGELRRRVNALAGPLRQPPRGRGPDGAPFDGPPPEQFRPPQQPGLGQSNDAGPGSFSRIPKEFHLPPQAANLFDESDTNGFYYIVWARDGNVLARSANAPAKVPLPPELPHFRKDLPRPDDAPPPMRASASEPPQAPRMREEFLELFQVTPPGEIILIGRSIASELSELRLVAVTLMAVGCGILLLGCAGGWWIATRAIRPIEDISATAVKISGGDLSQRISTTDSDSELGQLAGVLNATFARLEAAFAQQQQFTSDAAHELRTPVSVMLTQTQTALNRERSANEYRETVEACQRAAQRMRRLIESLLELARLDAGQEAMKRLQFDFSKTVNDCVELVKPLADERNVKIFCDLAALQCIGDSERLAQVVTNLLTNAIQYNQPGGEVRVKLGAQGGVAVLAVAGTGQGISAEDLPRVFERFYRADKSRSSGGNGLGLAISKAIVEAHGGTIEAADESGAGATFTVRLPVSHARG